MKPLPPPGQSPPGFSLIEMVGVLAIMAIVAAILTPNLGRRISRSNGEKEDKVLEALAEGLLQYVRANQTIPGSTTWTTNIAAFTGLTVDEVGRVNPSDSSTYRVYLINPSFSPGSPSSSPVWTQSSTGAASAANATLMILSSHKSKLYLPVKSGPAPSQSTYDSIWNWSYDPATKSSPGESKSAVSESGAGSAQNIWGPTWTGNGEYLHVKRINLAPLFQRVTFSNTDYPTNQPLRQVDNAPVTMLDSAAAVDAYYLNGTCFRLYKAKDAGGSLDLIHTLQSGVNFLYESNRWRIP